MKFVLNPKYENLRNFIEKIPITFYKQGNIIQAKRNLIKSWNINDLNLNIKCYHKPIFINRIVYSYFRNTKASKAYKNAFLLLEKGFNTPEPIAYIEQYKNGLLTLSYFISMQLTQVHEIREYYFTKGIKSEIPILTAFAHYTAQLHDNEILHLDYSPGNILITGDKPDKYDFSLVDINRMKFGKVDIRNGCRNFCRLFEYDEAAVFIAKEYAKSRNLNEQECIKLVLKYKHAFERKKKRKSRLKRFFKK